MISSNIGLLIMATMATIVAGMAKGELLLIMTNCEALTCNITAPARSVDATGVLPDRSGYRLYPRAYRWLSDSFSYGC